MTTPKRKRKPPTVTVEETDQPAPPIQGDDDPTDPVDNSIGWAVYDATLGQYLTGVIVDESDAQAWVDAASTGHTLQVHRV